jgi:hypothetical protein
VTVSKPPICTYCSHILPKRNGLMSCKAFETIPGMIAFNRLDHRPPVVGDNGIQFEQDPGRPLLDDETYDAVFKGTTGSADDSWSRASCRAGLNQRLRQAFVEGAEEDSRRRLGRGLTADELERVLWRYPGDLPDRQEP